MLRLAFRIGQQPRCDPTVDASRLNAKAAAEGNAPQSIVPDSSLARDWRGSLLTDIIPVISISHRFSVEATQDSQQITLTLSVSAETRS